MAQEPIAALVFNVTIDAVLDDDGPPWQYLHDHPWPISRAGLLRLQFSGFDPALYRTYAIDRYKRTMCRAFAEQP